MSLFRQIIPVTLAIFSLFLHNKKSSLRLKSLAAFGIRITGRGRNYACQQFLPLSFNPWISMG